MESNSKLAQHVTLAQPVTLTINSQGVVDLLTGLIRACGATTIVAFRADTNELYDCLHKLEAHCSSGLPELKISKRK